MSGACKAGYKVKAGTKSDKYECEATGSFKKNSKPTVCEKDTPSLPSLSFSVSPRSHQALVQKNVRRNQREQSAFLRQQREQRFLL